MDMSDVRLYTSMLTSYFGMVSIGPSAANTVVGSSVSTMQHRSRMLSIRFFIGFSPSFRVGGAYLLRLFLAILFSLNEGTAR